MSRLAHAVRELCLHLPDAVGGGQAGLQAERGEVRGIHQSVGSRSPAGWCRRLPGVRWGCHL